MKMRRIEPVNRTNYTQDSTYKQKSQRDNDFKEAVRKAAMKKDEKDAAARKPKVDTVTISKEGREYIEKQKGMSR